MMKSVPVSLLVALTVAAGCGGTGEALKERIGRVGSGQPDTFLTSDDYRDGEEIVGAHLTDEEYGRMVEDIERRGGELNWGWVAATGTPRKPAQLAFDIGGYETVNLAPVKNESLIVSPGIEEATWTAFADALRLLGLQVVEGRQADLSMEIAIVDLKSDKTFIWVGTLDPFLELEGRLVDTDSMEPLLLFRHQEHGTTVETAASDTASEVLKFLR